MDADVKRWFEQDGADLVRGLGVRRGQRVLDFGCGQGSWAVPLSQVLGPRGRLLAVDLNPENLDMARQRVADFAYPENVRFVQTQGETDLAFAEDTQFNAILIFDVLQHVEDWPGLFDSIVRILAEGGRLLINPSTLGHPGRVDLARLRQLLAERYFAQEACQRVRLMHYKHMAEDEILTFRRVSPFRRRVYDAISRIPAGRVATYAEIAREIGCGSAQAVGQALRHNPFAPVVPCHRVISSDLTTGGFSGERVGEEITRKLDLLKGEGVTFAKDRLTDPSRIWPLDR
jgi:methylated-DNA-[protein]-cysteine S-methyltransferase